MKDYYSLFEELALKHCKKYDYIDKKKLRDHNKAIKKLMLLGEEMKQIDCTDVFIRLLVHEDERVRLGAAWFGLDIGCLTQKSIDVLREIIEKSEDSTIAFAAKMQLKGKKLI